MFMQKKRYAIVSAILAFSIATSGVASAAPIRPIQEESVEMQELTKLENAQEVFEELQAGDYAQNKVTLEDGEYIEFTLQEGVVLTLPDLGSTNAGSQVNVAIVESAGLMRANPFGPREIMRINANTQRILYTIGGGALGGAIGGALGGAIGAGAGAWLSTYGTCYNDADLVIRTEKVISWLPYDDHLNSRYVYACAY